ncbi:MAG TPA: alpha/beta hydrolase [Bryobacteraceae bacterium]
MSQGYVPAGEGVRLFFQKVGDGPTATIVPNAFFMFDDFKRLANHRTLIFIDWRNRGRSDSADPQALARGIHHDIDDLEAVRRHFQFEKVAVIGHSYSALTAVLYAMKHPAHADRVVQLGAMQPFFGKDYPAHLKNVDETYAKVMSGLQQLEQERASTEPMEFCRKFWDLLRILFVTNPADAGKLAWDPCEAPNERNFMKQFLRSVLPSLQNLNLLEDDIARVHTPVLTIHGRKDRSAPYGGGMDWARVLPNARLLTVKEGGHFPWVEDPETVFAAIDAFLSGQWPEAAREVVSMDDE